MIAAIFAAEAAFWVFLVAGLAARYLARQERLSSWLLRCVPLVDVVLVALVAVDLARGAEPTQAHALAAVYLGFTVAFGHATISWADARFRYWFNRGPKPDKPAKGSRAEVLALWREWLRVLLTSAIASALLLVMLAIDGSIVPGSAAEASQHPYWSMMSVLGIVTAIWFLAGPAFAGRGRVETDATR